MALLQSRRLVNDDGLVGAPRSAAKFMTRAAACRRVLMRPTFRSYLEHVAASAIIAHKARDEQRRTGP